MTFPVVLAAVSLAVCAPRVGVPTTLFVDAGRGPIPVQLPSAYDPNDPAPLLVLLHGYSGSGPGVLNYWSVGTEADQRGFVLVAPDGTVDLAGLPFWNATPACCDFFGSGVDDSGYLRDLIEQIKAIVAVDPSRVHVAGYSNGGAMSYRMACDHAEAIASIVSQAGPTFDDDAACTPAASVHTLHVHGTNDNVVLYGGGLSQNGLPYPGALESILSWAGYGGCDPTPTNGTPLDLDPSIAGAETLVERYVQSCGAGASSELWTIVGGDHGPALGATFQTELFDWLEAHAKPVVGAGYCTSTVNSSGRRARLTVTGSTSAAAADLHLIASGAPSFVPGIFIAGPQPNQLPFGDGLLCVGPPVVRLPPTAATTFGGDAFLALDFQAPYAALLSPGAVAHFQFWFRDVPGGPAGFNLSDARSVALLP